MTNEPTDRRIDDDGNRRADEPGNWSTPESVVDVGDGIDNVV
jgi:hypothetical protein